MHRLVLLVALIVGLAVGQCALACSMAISDTAVCCSNSTADDPCCPAHPQPFCDCQDVDAAAVIPDVAEWLLSNKMCTLMVVVTSLPHLDNVPLKIPSAARAPPGLAALRSTILVL